LPVQEGPAKGEQERRNYQGSGIVNYFPCIGVEDFVEKCSGLLEKEGKTQKGKGLVDRALNFFDKQRNSNCQTDCCQGKGFHIFFTIYNFQAVMISANNLQVKVTQVYCAYNSSGCEQNYAPKTGLSYTNPGKLICQLVRIPECYAVSLLLAWMVLTIKSTEWCA